MLGWSSPCSHTVLTIFVRAVAVTAARCCGEKNTHIPFYQTAPRQLSTRIHSDSSTRWTWPSCSHKGESSEFNFKRRSAGAVDDKKAEERVYLYLIVSVDVAVDVDARAQDQ